MPRQAETSLRVATCREWNRLRAGSCYGPQAVRALCSPPWSRINQTVEAEKSWVFLWTNCFLCSMLSDRPQAVLLRFDFDFEFELSFAWTNLHFNGILMSEWNNKLSEILFYRAQSRLGAIAQLLSINHRLEKSLHCLVFMKYLSIK